MLAATENLDPHKSLVWIPADVWNNQMALRCHKYERIQTGKYHEKKKVLNYLEPLGVCRNDTLTPNREI